MLSFARLLEVGCCKVEAIMQTAREAPSSKCTEKEERHETWPRAAWFVRGWGR